MNKENTDIKYLGIPNICFSLTDKNDKRDKEFAKQRIKIGFDDSETWSLDCTIAKFIAPRLKRYLEIAPIEMSKKRRKKIERFLRAMEIMAQEDIFDTEIEKGLKVFPDIFRGLWW